MKKIFSICLLLVCCCIAKAQNNLQFNRVVIIQTDSISTCSGNCPDTISLRSFTVPADKVLKIESINFIAGNYLLFLDKTSFSKVSTNITNTFPIWLPSGTYSIYFSNYNSTIASSGQYAYTLSALEFNVVQ
ncbi:MAG: hypothetical protein IPP72_17960 [Chitinophagaceae bacterium]|nr:hypothetical protein [Chitinophagaceae bacterium]